MFSFRKRKIFGIADLTSQEINQLESAIMEILTSHQEPITTKEVIFRLLKANLFYRILDNQVPNIQSFTGNFLNHLALDNKIIGKISNLDPTTIGGWLVFTWSLPLEDKRNIKLNQLLKDF